jgi:phosphocarrier protein
MSLQITRTVTIRQPDGWHARPATEFARIASESGLEVTIGRHREAATRGDSVLSLLTIGARFGEELTVTVFHGESESNSARELLESLVALF